MRAAEAMSATFLIIGVTAAVSVLAWLIKPLLRALVLRPYLVRRRGQFHRIFTGGLVHADVGHLAVNMLALYFFADRVIARLGELLFLLLYVTAIVAAFLPSTLRFSKNSSYATLGASGAVAAVLFSAILLHPKLQLALLFIPLPIPGIVFGLVYLAYSAWHSKSQHDNVNHDAHFYGAAYGIIATWVLEPNQVGRSMRYWMSLVS